MREADFGDLHVRITGGDDREGGGDGPVVVLMHGFGAPGDDLVGLWRGLDVPRDVRFVFPEAPIDLGKLAGVGFSESRAWWLIDVERIQAAMARGEERDLARGVPEGMVDARAKVIAMLEVIQSELRVADDRVVLGGFSQGAMLATDVVLRTDRAFAGLVSLSGTIVAADEWGPLLAKRAGLPALLTHGRTDPLLPFAASERLAAWLRDANLVVTFVPFNGAHTIPGSAVDALSRFVREATTDGRGVERN